jgi:hypothetical protein
LTSSHKCWPNRSPTIIHGLCLQETAVTVSVEIVWLGLSPRRRRLRFSFQFNDVKDPHRLSPSPLFSAGGRRRRLLSDRPRQCQSAFSAFATFLRNPRIWPQKPPRAAEGHPSKSVTIRLRLGNILISNRRSSTFRRPPSLQFEPRPSGRRLLSGRPRGCQPILFRTPGRSPDTSGSSNQVPASSSGRANPSCPQPRGCRRLVPDPISEAVSGTYVPSATSSSAPFRAEAAI